jgi:hypothetical protein
MMMHWKLVLQGYTLAVGSSLSLTAFAWPYAAHAKGCQEHKMGYWQGLAVTGRTLLAARGQA